MQDTIYQFDHVTGVIEKIDEDSDQLAQALVRGTKIIITTIQKFPFAMERIKKLEKKTYAVIVDEAHSSQTGESANKMKEILSGEFEQEEEEKDWEDELAESAVTRGRQKNLSFFAFTATPKYKTLEIFGTKGIDNKPYPFHLYSMKQAIEEEFILDVLQNYITYNMFFKLNKKIEDDPRYDTKKARRAIARFMTLHPHNIAQKTEIIVEHFRNFVRDKINGKAKAMVVTASRPQALAYYKEIQEYIKKKNYRDIGVLVAFSPFKYKGKEEREANYNGFKEKELPNKFAGSDYQVLVVADKYQTGFDQPLLHTMYVDKKLSGVKAVQTLSRLNRIHAGKTDTFILDFMNDHESIQKAFQPYYQKTSIDESVDPDRLYDLKSKLENFKIILQSEVDSLCKAYFKNSNKKKAADHAELYRFVDPGRDRYANMKLEEKNEFKKTLTAYLRLYSFLAQFMPFHDVELEKFYVYCRFLLRRIPKEDNTGMLFLDDDVALTYYRLTKKEDGSIPLSNEDGEVSGPQDSGGGSPEEEESPLSQILEDFNKQFETDFTEQDLVNIMKSDEKLRNSARVNSEDSFKFDYKDKLLEHSVSNMKRGKFFQRMVEDEVFLQDFVKKTSELIYKKLRETG